MNAIEYCQIKAEEIDALDAIAAVKYAKERHKRGDLSNGFNPYRHALEQGDDACVALYTRDSKANVFINWLVYNS